MFGCQELGPDEEWHADSYAIDCKSDAHTGFKGAALFCIVLYPVGIPLTFLFLLHRDERSRRAWHATDESGPSAFDFVRKDYRCATPACH